MMILHRSLNFNCLIYCFSTDYFDRGQTALHRAAEHGQKNICYMLVAGGASLTMKDANGQTPMMLAFQSNNHELATYLESKMKHSKPYLEIVATI